MLQMRHFAGRATLCALPYGQPPAGLGAAVDPLRSSIIPQGRRFIARSH
jgi:hypothetical protein